MKTYIIFLVVELCILFYSYNLKSQTENIKPFSKQELKELGIIINDTGLFYKNYIKNDEFIKGHYVGKTVRSTDDIAPKDSIVYDTNPMQYPERIYFKKMKPSYNNFNYKIISDTLGTIFFSITMDKEKPILFPVEVTSVDKNDICGKNGTIFWFVVTDAFLEKLPDRFKKLKNYNYKNRTLKEFKKNKF